jgi:hypothetical protein
MKCQECQRLILIQDLLEAGDRVLMNQHITTCAACQKFQAESIRVNQLIEQASAKAPQPAKAPGLTDKIMTAVMTPAPRKISQQESWMFNPFTRLALSGLSLCLVIFFLIEWQSPANTELPKGPVAGLQQVILNSQSFRKELSSREKRKSLLSSCISPDKKQADIACLKEKMKSIQF